MILEKHFVFTPDKGCIAKNMADVENYIKGKIAHFQIYDNWISKNEHISLYSEILKMVGEDVQTPDVDLSPISHLLYYDKINIEKFIMYFDLVYILGSISYSVFDYGSNALRCTENGEHGAINLSDMLFRGYKEYVAIKGQNGNAAYGSTLIFTTILEAELKRKFKFILIDELVAAVEAKIQSGSYVPSADDITIIECLKGTRTDYNSVYVLTEGADQLFDKTGVYDPHNKAEQISLMLNKMTLNQLLQSNIFSMKAEPDFLEIMKLLFSTRNLNFRNDIAHGGFGYQNYYHMAGAGLLYLLLVAVVNDFWKK